MSGRRWLTIASLFAALLIVLAAASAGAQASGSLVAFVNSSGQLIVSNGDASYRWIVTNPGETPVSPLGYRWSPDGRRLFFAVGSPADLSLRVGDTGSQSVVEIGRAGGALSGGAWMPDGSGILLALDNRLLVYPAGGGAPAELLVSGGVITLRSPFDGGNSQPNLPLAASLSADGRFVFGLENGRNTLYIPGNGALPLPGTNDAAARFNGLWSDPAPLLATWGYEGNSILSVTYAPTGETLTLDSGRSAPIHPLAWRPGTTQLVYRDATNFVRITDLGCMAGSCGGANPLALGAELLPASAADVQVDRQWAYFLNGETVQAVNLGCFDSGAGGCPNTAVTLGTNVAPQTWLHVSGSTLAYTAYAADAYNMADREVRVVNLGCLGSPASCLSQPVLSGAAAGLVSPDGGHVVVQLVSGGLNALRLADGNSAYLSDPAGGSLLSWARWS